MTWSKDDFIKKFEANIKNEYVELHRAIKSGDLSKTQELIINLKALNSELDSRYKMTPLITAIYYNQPEIFLWLLKQDGIQIDLAANSYSTPETALDTAIWFFKQNIHSSVFIDNLLMSGAKTTFKAYKSIIDLFNLKHDVKPEHIFSTLKNLSELSFTDENTLLHNFNVTVGYLRTLRYAIIQDNDKENQEEFFQKWINVSSQLIQLNIHRLPVQLCKFCKEILQNEINALPSAFKDRLEFAYHSAKLLHHIDPTSFDILCEAAHKLLAEEKTDPSIIQSQNEAQILLITQEIKSDILLAKQAIEVNDIPSSFEHIHKATSLAAFNKKSNALVECKKTIIQRKDTLYLTKKKSINSRNADKQDK